MFPSSSRNSSALEAIITGGHELKTENRRHSSVGFKEPDLSFRKSPWERRMTLEPGQSKTKQKPKLNYPTKASRINERLEKLEK